MGALRRFVSRWCWSCTAAGAGLLVLSTIAMAQAPHDGGAFGYTPSMLITALLGLLTLLIGAYTAGMKAKQDKQEEEHARLKEGFAAFRIEVARDYMPAAALRQQLTRMEDDIRRVHERFDRLGIPSGGKG